MTSTRRIAIALELNQPWPWHHEVYSGVLRYARERGGWTCVIDEYPELAELDSSVPTPSYDGAIARTTQSLADWSKQVGVSLVNVWFSSPVRGVPLVSVDRDAVGRLCAEHLLARGFRRFARLMPARYGGERLEGEAFARAVEAAGFAVQTATAEPREFLTPWAWQQMRQEIRELLDQLDPPVGIVTWEPDIARQVVHLCEQRGWAVPRDAAIICVKDASIVAGHTSPSLTSLDCNWEAVGYEAARLLDSLMQNERPPGTSIELPPRGVIPRASTDFFAVEDELVADALHYIAHNLRESLNVERIADAIATSPSTLRRRFRTALGRSVSSEVRRLRLESAKRMLAEPDRAVFQVAQATGFGPAKRLSEIFQRELGVTPTAYRQQVLGQS
jgi:LacI family transcriptional regulator